MEAETLLNAILVVMGIGITIAQLIILRCCMKLYTEYFKDRSMGKRVNKKEETETNERARRQKEQDFWLSSNLDVIRNQSDGGNSLADEEGLTFFALAMRDKLLKKRFEGRGFWWDPAACDIDALKHMLAGHVHKKNGDMVDVGNLAMMIYIRQRMEN
ncbi:MAG: hypothetical protein KAR06_08040 [Deltaproteobacteria bacterium]|nr:hypothetical protein [Deltaproteobacteria bacterium]